MGAPARNLDASVIPDVLAQYGELTRRALRTYLPKSSAQDYLYPLLGDYPNRGGKMMRASLCLATARVFGADVEDAVASTPF